MMMMTMEEVVQEDHQNQVLGSKEISQIIKGKRTKRQRPLSPLDLTMAVSTSSAEAITSNYSSPTTSTNYGFTEISSSTTTNTEEEEEDMANCLILLAQGHLTPREKPNTQKVLFQSEKPAENNISAIGNHNKSGGALTSTGLFAYQCKTCDRCFSSFQALGGHRASHKKPKVNPNGNNNKKSLLSFIEQENIIGHHNFDNQNSTSTDLSLQISNRNIGLNNNSTIANNKPKVHECSICGAEFTSGQALGGHMRRHRSFINTTQTTAMGTTTTTTSLVSSSLESRELKKSRNVLQLDLNLPAPEDDRRESKFPFAGKEQVIVFSHASPLVDCHYS